MSCPDDSGNAGKALSAAEIVDAGRGISRRIQVVNVPVVRASSVLFDSVQDAVAEGPPATVGELHRATYATSGTETTFALMDALATLEGRPHRCRAALMPSGLAAISTALLAFTQPGDHLLMSDSVYGPARVFVTTLLARFGVRTTFFDPQIEAEGVGGLADLEAGATGSMTGGGYPDGLRPIVDDYLAGRREQARAGYERWLPLINYENRQCGPLACKILMKEGGVITSDAPRHPFAPVHPETRKGLIDTAQRLDPLVLRWGK